MFPIYLIPGIPAKDRAVPICTIHFAIHPAELTRRDELLSVLPQRVAPPQTWKSIEVGVGRYERAAVLDGHGSMLSICGQFGCCP
jgi:hypothetical protein